MTWMLGFLDEVGRLGRRLLTRHRDVVFEIRVRDGRPRVAHGRVTPAFLLEVQGVCDDLGVADGVIYGQRRDRAIHLVFAGLPAACQQRLRNLWGIHGWPPPR
jgi:hypothetical protein